MDTHNFQPDSRSKFCSRSIGSNINGCAVNPFGMRNWKLREKHGEKSESAILNDLGGFLLLFGWEFFFSLYRRKKRNLSQNTNKCRCACMYFTLHKDSKIAHRYEN